MKDGRPGLAAQETERGGGQPYQADESHQLESAAERAHGEVGVGASPMLAPPIRPVHPGTFRSGARRANWGICCGLS